MKGLVTTSYGKGAESMKNFLRELLELRMYCIIIYSYLSYIILYKLLYHILLSSYIIYDIRIFPIASKH